MLLLHCTKLRSRNPRYSVGTPKEVGRAALLRKIIMKRLSVFNGRIAAALNGLRRTFGFLTENEVQGAYLAEAQDRVDLERRMRELDHPRRSSAVHLGYSWNA
jgi:hypothetical protein